MESNQYKKQMIEAIDSLTARDNGRFLNWRGEELPWQNEMTQP
ncbi:MAG: hypothetical protein ACREOB_04980 [Thermodesulfobacteriota bacterium]